MFHKFVVPFQIHKLKVTALCWRTSVNWEIQHKSTVESMVICTVDSSFWTNSKPAGTGNTHEYVRHSKPTLRLIA